MTAGTETMFNKRFYELDYFQFGNTRFKHNYMCHNLKRMHDNDDDWCSF